MLTGLPDVMSVNIEEIGKDRHGCTDGSEGRQCIRDTKLGVDQIARDSDSTGS